MLSQSSSDVCHQKKDELRKLKAEIDAETPDVMGKPTRTKFQVHRRKMDANPRRQ